LRLLSLRLLRPLLSLLCLSPSVVSLLCYLLVLLFCSRPLLFLRLGLFLCLLCLLLRFLSLLLSLLRVLRGRLLLFL
jgi:hypothetical protein